MKRYEYKNMIVTANNDNGNWIVKLAINGKIVNTFESEDMREAADVYVNTVNAMLAR